MIDKNKTYRTRDGRAVCIYTTNGGGEHPIHGAVKVDNSKWRIETWTRSGRYNSLDYCSDDDSQYPDDPLDLVEYNPLSELKVDDRILVRDVDGETWSYEHFARVSENGKAMTFEYGRTSWSSDRGELVEWNQWKLPDGDNSFCEQQTSGTSDGIWNTLRESDNRWW